MKRRRYDYLQEKASGNEWKRKGNWMDFEIVWAHPSDIVCKRPGAVSSAFRLFLIFCLTLRKRLSLLVFSGFFFLCVFKSLVASTILTIMNTSTIHCMIFFKDFIYLFMRDTEREAETQAEGEAGSMQGTWCGTPSRDSGIMLWAEGRRSTAEPPRCPSSIILKRIKYFWVR